MMLMNPRVNRILHSNCFGFLVGLLGSSDPSDLDVGFRGLFPYASDRNRLYSFRFFAALVEIMRLWQQIVVPVLDGKKKVEADGKIKSVSKFFEKFPGNFYLGANVGELREQDRKFFGQHHLQIGFQYDEIDPERQREDRKRSVFGQPSHDPRLFSDRKGAKPTGLSQFATNLSRNDQPGVNYRFAEPRQTNLLAQGSQTGYVPPQTASHGNSPLHQRSQSLQLKSLYQKYEERVRMGQPDKSEPAEVVGAYRRRLADLVADIFAPEVFCDKILRKRYALQEFSNQNHEVFEHFLFDKSPEKAAVQKQLMDDLNFANQMYDTFMVYFTEAKIGQRNYTTFLNRVSKAEMAVYSFTGWTPASATVVYASEEDRKERKTESNDCNDALIGKLLSENQSNRSPPNKDSSKRISFQEYFANPSDRPSDAPGNREAIQIVEGMRQAISRGSKRSSLSSRPEGQNRTARISFDPKPPRTFVFNVSEEEYAAAVQSNSKKGIMAPGNDYHRLRNDSLGMNWTASPLKRVPGVFSGSKMNTFGANTPRSEVTINKENRTAVEEYCGVRTPAKRKVMFTHPETHYEVSEYLCDDSVQKIKTKGNVGTNRAPNAPEKPSPLGREARSNRSREVLKIIAPVTLMNEFVKRDDEYNQLRQRYDQLKKKYTHNVSGELKSLLNQASPLDRDIERKWLGDIPSLLPASRSHGYSIN
jgi:hypothetical protein